MHLASSVATDLGTTRGNHMKKMHTGLMSAAALLLSAAALAAPQGTPGGTGPMGQSSSATQSGSTGSGSSSMRGSSGASSSSQLDSQDRKFIMEAASAGMFEVQAAQLAQSKAQDPSAKSYAQQMLQDHQRNNQQLMQIAQTKGVTPPTKLEAKHQAMLSKLQNASASDFDKQYGKLMDQSHQDTLKLFQRGEKQVKDTELKSYIAQTLPKLEQHHQQAASLPGATGSSRTAEADRSGSSSGSSSRSGSSSDDSTSGGSGSSSDRSSSSMGGSSSGGSSSSSMGGTGGSSSGGSMGGTSGSSTSGSSGSSSSGSSSSTTRPPGSSSSSSNSDTGSTGRP
jgi:putative membrane protein